MSSFVRTIERTPKRKFNKFGKGVGIHYNLRGSKLGTKNPKDPCVVPAAKKKPKAWRARHKVDAAARKPCAPRTVPQPLAPRLTKAQRREAHRERMTRKAMVRAIRANNLGR